MGLFERTTPSLAWLTAALWTAAAGQAVAENELKTALEAQGVSEDEAAPEVVIVTIQKREEDILDVPASVSVFDETTLEGFDIDSIRDVSRLTPNFLGSSFNNTQPIFAIRGGANTLSAIGTGEPVGVYIDEVYVPRFSSADFELFDLERVEVLRGPQGTFFGRNVASGAILITTKKPSLEGFEAKLQGSYGNLDAYEIRGLVSGPVSDTIAAKLSVSRVERDGYGFDTLARQEQDDLVSTSVRGSLLWKPTEDFEAILSFDYTADENGGRTLAALDFGDGDLRTSELGLDQNFDRTIYGGSLRMTYDIDAGQFVSITGLRASDSDEIFSFVGLNFSLLPFAFQQVNQDLEEPRTISQELRFVSTDLGGFDFIAGLFYLNEDSDRLVDRQRLLAGSGAVILDEVFDQNIKTNAIAGYVDGTVRLTDKIELSAGVRYTFENREATLNYINRLALERSFLAEGLEEDFGAFTPRFAIVYHPADDISLFASITRGFTAGGFNTEADALNEIITPFDEETILSYEIGAKTRFADGQGTANVTLFYQDYSDKQEFVFNPNTFVGTILNAGEATIQGVEIELGWRFNDYLRVDATYGFLDTEFDSFRIAGGPGNTGNELGNAPSHQFAIRGDGRYPVFGGSWELFANASYAWTHEYFTGATNDPNLFVESYGLLNSNAGIRSADGRWQIEVWGSNLLDKEFVLIPSSFIIQAQHLGPPRLYGGRITWSY